MTTFQTSVPSSCPSQPLDAGLACPHLSCGRCSAVLGSSLTVLVSDTLTRSAKVPKQAGSVLTWVADMQSRKQVGPAIAVVAAAVAERGGVEAVGRTALSSQLLTCCCPRTIDLPVHGNHGVRGRCWETSRCRVQPGVTGIGQWPQLRASQLSTRGQRLGIQPMSGIPLSLLFKMRIVAAGPS